MIKSPTAAVPHWGVYAQGPFRVSLGNEVTFASQTLRTSDPGGRFSGDSASIQENQGPVLARSIQKGESNMETREIDLDKKSESEAVDPVAGVRPCPTVGVNPGDIVNWTSSKIKDEREVTFVFTQEHPFKEPPKLRNNVVAEVLFSYIAREGTKVLGCGALKLPCGPPGHSGGSGQPGTSKTLKGTKLGS
jgi:hypothetical protein